MSKVLILGAGASFGHGVLTEPRPPVSTGFFSHPLAAPLARDYTDLFQYIRETVRIDVLSKPKQDIEDVFARVESGWKLSGYQYEEALSRFDVAIASINPVDMLCGYLVDVVYLSTKWLQNQNCPYHTYLCTDWLEADDSVISFNYDLIIDCSMKNAGIFDESYGYGLTNNKELTTPTATVLLLKPHGSLNWFKEDEFVTITQALGNSPNGKAKEQKKIVRILPIDSAVFGRSFRNRNNEAIVGRPIEIVKPLKDAAAAGNTGQLNGAASLIVGTYTLEPPWLMSCGMIPLIVFPTPYKSLEVMTFDKMKQVWKHVYKSIVDCDEVLAIGFSFRDEHFNQIIIESSFDRPKPLRFRVVTKSRENFSRISRRLSAANLQIEHINGWLEDFVTKYSS